VQGDTTMTSKTLVVFYAPHPAPMSQINRNNINRLLDKRRSLG
jgi:hypothetical protein